MVLRGERGRGEATRRDAPDESHNLACMMMVDYWDGVPDPPHVIRQADGGGKDFWTSPLRSGNSLRYSGAMVLLTPTQGAPCYLMNGGTVRQWRHANKAPPVLPMP